MFIRKLEEQEPTPPQNVLFVVSKHIGTHVKYLVKFCLQKYIMNDTEKKLKDIMLKLSKCLGLNSGLSLCNGEIFFTKLLNLPQFCH